MLTSRETRSKSLLSEKVYISLTNERTMCLVVLFVASFYPEDMSGVVYASSIAG